MTFAYKRLDFTFALGGKTFANGAATIKITGLRASVSVSAIPQGGTVEGTIYGLTKSQMNQLSTYGRQYLPEAGEQNLIMIEAGDVGGASSVVFSGPIQNSYADYNDAPNNPFVFNAVIGQSERLMALQPSSYPGSAAVADIMGKLAVQIGRTFENNGVDTRISNAYLHGSAWNQISSIAKAANINWIMDQTTLAIWPLGGSRGNSGITISPTTGLHGYPSFTAYGPFFECEYNPALKWGQQVTLQSSLQPACVTRTIQMLTHTLESETPGGRWISTVQLGQY